MKNQKIDYTGKKVYVGIDVHKRTYSITAICESEVTKKTTMSAQPSMLALCFKSWFRGAKIHSVYGTWLVHYITSFSPLNSMQYMGDYFNILSAIPEVCPPPRPPWWHWSLT